MPYVFSHFSGDLPDIPGLPYIDADCIEDLAFDIDGLRLDVAYCLDREFLRRLREFTDGKKNDFFTCRILAGRGEAAFHIRFSNLHSRLWNIRGGY